MKQFLFGSSFMGNKSFNIGWLLFRFYIGITIAIGAGWPKMNELSAPGWFVKQVSELGFNFPSPSFWAAAAAWGEFVGGLCIAIGFFTRFSAIQLAFQFFVVAFIWYDNPMPMFGMYYQQLLLWGFVLIAFAGSGRFAVDAYIMKRKTVKINPQNFVATATMFVLALMLASFSYKNEPTLKASELNDLQGTWNGTLTYKDYTSGYSESLPVTIYCMRKGNEQRSRTWILKYEYPQEPKANNKSTYIISKDGKKINGEPIVEKIKMSDGTLKVVTEIRGKDGNNNEPCTFRHVFKLSPTSLTITKFVKFDKDAEYFQRNEYKLSR